MPLQIIRNDLTLMVCDAVVNPTNEQLAGTGGVDGKLRRAAGPELAAACAKIGFCAPGNAVLTRGYDLPARYVIHTVGPRWVDGTHGEAETLERCYRACLALAAKRRFSSVAFPIIAAGSFGFPKEQALEIATREIGGFLRYHDMTVYLVVYDADLFQIGKQRFQDIAEYIDEHYVQAHTLYNAREPMVPRREEMERSEASMAPLPMSGAAPAARPAAGQKKPRFSLRDLERDLDESFSQMLLRKIDEQGMKDAECYKKANVDRKLFSKIRKDVYYKPSKPTAIAFAIALELDLRETEELLKKAGFALSHSNRFDVIIEYFIVHGNYDIFEINEALFAFDQPLLGA